MGVALLLRRTIRIQRYRTQQIAKPDRTGEMTLETVPAARTGPRNETRISADGIAAEMDSARAQPSTPDAPDRL
jgi:hypothetical protein